MYNIYINIKQFFFFQLRWKHVQNSQEKKYAINCKKMKVVYDSLEKKVHTQRLLIQFSTEVGNSTAEK